MKTILVPDMMCQHCVQRITDSLTKAGLHFRVSLEDKQVLVDGDDSCVKTALGELQDLGFSPELP